jgi:hypothetical protein
VTRPQELDPRGRRLRAATDAVPVARTFALLAPLLLTFTIVWADQPLECPKALPKADCERIQARQAELSERIRRTTLPSGWRVDCLEDLVLGRFTCFAATFGVGPGGRKSIPFQVQFSESPRGQFTRRIMPGHHTDPSREPVVRVDDNEAFVGAAALTSDEIVGQLKTGTTARIRYWPFPRGPEDATVDLNGFVEAYELLLEKVQALRESRRPQ